MRAHIIYANYLKPDGNGMSIGGIQTYITNLIPVLRAEGYEVHVYQRATVDFIQEINQATIHGYKHEDTYTDALFQYMFGRLKSGVNKAEDLIIFGSDVCAVVSEGYHTIGIQHGIGWDIPATEQYSKLMYFRYFLRKVRISWNIINKCSLVKTLVCVDHNFVNWCRALTPYPKNRLHVIPNFSEVPSQLPHKEEGPIRIIFARRFFPYRGTRLFTHAITRILQEHQNIEVIIAGTGPDEQYMRERLEQLPGVTFTTYDSSDSLRIHRDKQIAVIPTTGSEGTSLSLLEAMSSGCAVVCTNVGGMTNVVLDHYNGIMISPDEDELYHALKELIDDAKLRKILAARAYDTVRNSFSLEVWRQKWTNIIRNAKR